MVTIRAPTAEDTELLLAARDEEWLRWLGPGSDHPSPTACIVVAGEVVGWVDYDTDQKWLQPGEVNVGYNIAEFAAHDPVFALHRGKGYASRAVELLLRHLERSTTTHTATLLIAPGNVPSQHVAARTGFVATGEINGSGYFKRVVRPQK